MRMWDSGLSLLSVFKSFIMLLPNSHFLPTKHWVVVYALVTMNGSTEFQTAY